MARHGTARLARTLAFGALLVAAPAGATPFDALPVGDPIEAELRVLDLYPSARYAGRIALPHLGTRPLRLYELQGDAAPPDRASLPPAARIALERLERVLGRDAAEAFTPDPTARTTPRAFARSGDGDQRVELSVGLEGTGEVFDDDSRFVNGSGLQARLALGLDRWLVYTHLLAGHVDEARRFADPIVPNNDFIVHTEDTYLAYTGEGGRWGGRIGRTRWHWGPGEEGSLALSKSAPAMTGVSLSATLASIGLHATTLSATLDQSSGEQLAAHRIEWQPVDALRVGLTETARYESANWQPLYLVGVIPYILVQRFLVQDAPDSLGQLRNNVMIGLDASWRIADGTRVYGEVLVDDLHARTSKNPNKLAWQVGWDGAGTAFGRRVTWGGEWTRVWRFVYTSFFDRSYALRGEPLGFPTGPDARRVRVRGTFDPSAAWQLFGHVAHTAKGENDLDEPYIPGSPGVKPQTFEGVVETTREIAAGVRFWPASGVDVSLAGGYRWVDDAGHVPGASADGAEGRIVLRLTR